MSRKHSRHKYDSRMPRHRKVKYAVAAVVAVILVIAVYFGATHLESTLRRHSDQAADAESSEHSADQVLYDGKWYEKNDRISAYLILGVDTDGTVAETTKAAQADFNLVVVLDKENEAYTLLQLNRDTMMDVRVLGTLGEETGTKYGQLALGHTYGSGKEDSCVNQMNCVSDLLYGVKFDGYIAANMDVVSMVNDQVGGVTVTIEDDFSQVDPTLVQGSTMTLTGKQALTFVRSRFYVDDSTNLSRMNRQRTYMEALTEKLKEKAGASNTFAIKLFRSIGDYTVANVDANEFGGLAQTLVNFENKGIVTIDGEAKRGEEFMEFYADEDDLKQKVVNLFYKPVE